ncbi:hypothetical protein [Mesorhizobium cantuariense]|uniref:DUF3768 domain-containing protein n=1 Tax=Mesorhizobium cantuariense TaxID=1300275 RepID=A0ABV7MW94_9HYPH
MSEYLRRIEAMDGFRIEKESPILDLRPGSSFDSRASDWLNAAQHLLDFAIADERDEDGRGGEELHLVLTARQADHLAMGLGIMAAHFRRPAA